MKEKKNINNGLGVPSVFKVDTQINPAKNERKDADLKILMESSRNEI
jgi:hypothetical protein